MGKRKCAVEGMVSPEFFQGKRILITGHTGFKGTWLCRMLADFGADVTGYALLSPTKEGAKVFRSVIGEDILSVEGDIRDIHRLKQVFMQEKPEIVFHLAAQPIVVESYSHPLETYEVNVMGTVNLMECVRVSGTVKSVVNVTTDKVYENKEWVWGYRETDTLNGYDPYSNSKSCSELVTHCYAQSFFTKQEIAVSTLRAGNVIGGGDFSPYRILPDCVRAAITGNDIEVRNPEAVRPYQHVLEPLYAYLMVAQAQWYDNSYSGCYNVGPDERDAVTTGILADIFCELWNEGQQWRTNGTNGPHEANLLRLDCSKLKTVFGWEPRWGIRKAVQSAVEWYKVYVKNGDIREKMSLQIQDFLKCNRRN